MQRLKVAAASQSYEVVVGNGLTNLVASTIEKLQPSSSLLLYDANVKHHADSLSIENRIELPAGEACKSFDTYRAVVSQLSELERPLDRKSLIIGMGGGAALDIAGFVASTYMRGIRWIGLPTSLLAMVDASVGGKTAINLEGTKNLIGSFHQPSAVIADIDWLATLPDREYRAGLAEAVKMAALLDVEVFDVIEAKAKTLLERDATAIEALVFACVQIKARVVEEDELESGLRAVLNYGHTIGHALEALAPDGELLHGEAVAIGMHCAARLAVSRGECPQEFMDRQSELLAALGLSLSVPEWARTPDILSSIKLDKKRSGAKVKWVLPRGLGAYAFWDCADAELADALKFALGRAV